MAKYTITADDRFLIPLYIDISNKNKLKVYSKQEAEQIQKKKIEENRLRLNTLVHIGDDKITEDQKKEKEQIEIKIEQLLEEGETPKELVEEKTYWLRPDGGADEYISEEGYDRNDYTMKVTYNRPKHNKALVQVLLKAWTLQEDNPKLKLEFAAMQGMPEKMILTQKCISNIWELKPEILTYLINEAYLKLFGGTEAAKK